MLGVILNDLGPPEEGLERHQEALNIQLQALPPDHPHIAESLYRIAKVLDALSRPEEAKERRAEADAIRRGSSGQAT